jgi:hypothetical protein
MAHILDAGTHYWPFIRWGDNFTVRSYAVGGPELVEPSEMVAT